MKSPWTICCRMLQPPGTVNRRSNRIYAPVHIIGLTPREHRFQLVGGPRHITLQSHAHHHHPIVTYQAHHPTVTYQTHHSTVTYQTHHPTVTYQPHHSTVTYQTHHPTVTYQTHHPTVTSNRWQYMNRAEAPLWRAGTAAVARHLLPATHHAHPSYSTPVSVASGNWGAAASSADANCFN